MSDELRDRYRALLRWYPADYRTERGDEIVETYLDLARPGQRRPSPADIVDLLRGGVRQHLRARHALGLVDALPFAAHLALTTAASLAGLSLFRAERLGGPEAVFLTSMGPFITLGALVWILWLLAPLATLLGAGRPMVTVALLGTVALIPASALTEYLRPPLLVLVPQAALGLVALAVPGPRESSPSRRESSPSSRESSPSSRESSPRPRESSPSSRESLSERRESPLTTPGRRWSLPAAAGLAVTAVTGGLAALSQPAGLYYFLLPSLSYAGLLLALVVVGAAVVFTARRDPRGWWPALILLGPLLLLFVSLPFAAHAQPWPTWPVAAVTTAAAVLVAIAAVPAALWLRGKPQSSGGR